MLPPKVPDRRPVTESKPIAIVARSLKPDVDRADDGRAILKSRLRIGERGGGDKGLRVLKARS
jgi:hypothetical protein